jgi:hypothetical protein
MARKKIGEIKTEVFEEKDGCTEKVIGIGIVIFIIFLIGKCAG